MATYNVKITMPAITSNESEVIAFQTTLFCHGVGCKIGRKMSTTLAGCNEKPRYNWRAYSLYRGRQSISICQIRSSSILNRQSGTLRLLCI